MLTISSLWAEMENCAQGMSQGPLLKVSNVDVFHGTFQALWDVSLEVNVK